MGRRACGCGARCPDLRNLCHDGLHNQQAPLLPSLHRAGPRLAHRHRRQMARHAPVALAVEEAVEPAPAQAQPAQAAMARRRTIQTLGCAAGEMVLHVGIEKKCSFFRGV